LVRLAATRAILYENIFMRCKFKLCRDILILVNKLSSPKTWNVEFYRTNVASECIWHRAHLID
jgi:hypothetical protein